MRARTNLILLLSVAILFVLVFISVVVGSFSLTPSEIIGIVTGSLTDTVESRVFFNLRLPRTAMAVLSGLSLGLSGAIYQIIFRNPLASPDITGVASGASLGAGLAIVMHASTPLVIILFSFLGGILSLVALFFLTYITGMRRMSNFLFAGIVIKCLADAGLMIVKTIADPHSQLAAIEFWIMGSLATVTAEKLTLPLIGICISIAVLLLLYRQILLLSLGDENAIAVGINPTLWRAVLLTVSTFMISCTVSIIGTVAFVGLIAPHIALMITRNKGGTHLFSSMIIGAIITVFADIVARTASSGAELPLSIPVIIISVPVLVFLVIKTRGETV